MKDPLALLGMRLLLRIFRTLFRIKIFLILKELSIFSSGLLAEITATSRLALIERWHPRIFWIFGILSSFSFFPWYAPTTTPSALLPPKTPTVAPGPSGSRICGHYMKTSTLLLRIVGTFPAIQHLLPSDLL